MSTEKSGWDKIAEQEAQSTKKEKTKEKLETAAKTTSNVAWIIFVAGAAVVGIVVLTILSL